MHEFALAEDILKTIGARINHDFKNLSQINITVGSLSGVVIDSLEFGLQIVMKEKNNLSVRINIDQAEARAQCQCGKQYILRSMFDECPVCKSLQRKIMSGTDIVINSIEIRENKKGDKIHEKKP
jgi:hydrogenase nickel incorporation protein HypA/HybF